MQTTMLCFCVICLVGRGGGGVKTQTDICVYNISIYIYICIYIYIFVWTVVGNSPFCDAKGHPHHFLASRNLVLKPWFSRTKTSVDASNYWVALVTSEVS